MSIPKRIGFIGLGVMGAPMAARLIGAGYPVVAYHHRLQKVEALASLGADFAPSPLELARRCDRVILMVRYSSAVEELVLGPSGLMGEPVRWIRARGRWGARSPPALSASLHCWKIGVLRCWMLPWRAGLRARSEAR